MLDGIYRAAMGMRGQLEIQDTLANNLANGSTVAFKRHIPVFQDTIAKAEAQTGANGTGSLAPAPVSISNGVAYTAVSNISPRDTSEGSLKQTGDPLDLALDGGGYFTLQAADGSRVYSRAGAFQKGIDGALVNAQGLKVLDDQGNPIDITGKDVSVTVEGDIVVDKQTRGRLLITQLGDAGEAEELDGGLFRSSKAAAASGYQVRQGVLEESNVNVVEEMVSMISALRAYEAAQKAITSADSTLQKAANEVGRVA